jgi:phosphatidate cytidylyltransferase
MHWSSPETRQVIFWIAGILTFFSILGRVLRLRVKTEKGQATIANLISRVRAWWVMAGLVIGALMLGQTATEVVFGLISLLALREFITATPTRRADHQALFLAFFVALPLQYWLVHIHWYNLFVILIPVYAFVILPCLSVVRGDTQDFLARTARTQWGLMVCVYFISHIPMLLRLPFPPLPLGNAGLVLFLIIVTQGSDVLQYIWGKLCGRRKIAPLLSPGKTWEGFLGGVLSASALGAGLHWLTPCNPWQAFVISLMLCALGFLGGLIMSAIKRERGIKDWGTLIEGHGGILDRIDSLCFSTPLYFHVLYYQFGLD